MQPKSTKTTILGILTIVAAASHAAMQLFSGAPIDFIALGTAVTTGFGLIFAADHSAVVTK